MKTSVILLSFVLLSACSVYTVTNKTKMNLQICPAGGGSRIIVKAGECVYLNEYFVGLGGDFPFLIGKNHCDKDGKEFSADNYEITTEHSQPYETVVSTKNPDCDKDEKNGKTVESASEEKVYCLRGEAHCVDEGASAMCIKAENGNSQPACVKDNKKTNNNVTCKTDDSTQSNTGVSNNNPKCLKPVTVTSPTKTVSCGVAGSGQNGAGSVLKAECKEGGIPVCGKINESQKTLAYCVNDNTPSIQWPGSVTCSNGSPPTCKDKQ